MWFCLAVGWRMVALAAGPAGSGESHGAAAGGGPGTAAVYTATSSVWWGHAGPCLIPGRTELYRLKRKFLCQQEMGGEELFCYAHCLEMKEHFLRVSVWKKKKENGHNTPGHLNELGPWKFLIAFLRRHTKEAKQEKCRDGHDEASLQQDLWTRGTN